ncbi:MAG: DUF167 domain-containing protein [Desulforhopalus sp.]
MPYISSRSDKSVILKLYVQPKAAKNRLVGLHDGCLKLAVAAPPVDGKANKQVLKFLATILGIPASALSLSSGAQSRRKQVVVKSLDASSVRNRIEKSLVDL